MKQRAIPAQAVESYPHQGSVACTIATISLPELPARAFCTWVEETSREKCTLRHLAAYSAFLSYRFVVTVPWLLRQKNTSDTTAQFKTQPSFHPDGILARDRNDGHDLALLVVDQWGSDAARKDG